MKSLIIFFLIGILFFNSCQTQSSHKASFEHWLTIKLDLNNSLFDDQTCFGCLGILNYFQKEGNTYIVFLDYKPGVIYLYNHTYSKFESKFKIPKEPKTEPAHILHMYNVDSILYFNHTKKQFVFCDSTRIKSISYGSGLNDTLDSAIIIYPITGRLRSVNGYFLFDIMPKFTQNTAPYYYDLNNNTPFIGMFESKDFSFKFKYLPIMRPFKESRQHTLVNNWNIYDVDSANQIIFFQNKCMNDLYQFDLKTNETKKIKVRNSSFEIEPIFVSKDPFDPNVLNEASNKQSFCSKLFYYSKQKVLLRQLSVINSQKDRIRYLQLINKSFEVTDELELPTDYLTEFQTEDNFILQRYDPKTKTIILEKLHFDF